MPNLIIAEDGCYISTQFSGKNGSWILIGSISSGDIAYSKTIKSWKNTSVATTIDEFRNTKTGELMETTRIKVYNKAEKGDIF